jgi:hypothetical protein
MIMKNKKPPPFIKGIKLCELFYQEAVRPILALRFPKLIYSAARLDYGSDVLGFDTPQSMDHDWGPKATLFLSEEDHNQYHEKIDSVLAEELPYEVHGYPTNFADNEDGTKRLEPISNGPIRHGVAVTTLRRFFEGYVGLDPTQGVSELDWLTIPQQRLRTIASGNVFHDGLNQLEPARRRLSWYPRDVWLYLMANAWRRIDQEEPFMGRCGDVGDELGSRIVGARLVSELMRLCFLIEKRYAPYYKWFGSAFSELGCSKELTPLFHKVYNSANWKEREERLTAAYLIVARMHNDFGITEPIEPKVSPFFNRPYLVLHSSRFVESIYGAIQSETVKSLPQHVGAIWQFVDSTDVLTSIEKCKALTAIYREA